MFNEGLEKDTHMKLAISPLSWQTSASPACLCSDANLNHSMALFVRWFFQETAVIVTKPTVVSWYTKHQGLCPWLTYARVVATQLVFAAISNISVNFEN